MISAGIKGDRPTQGRMRAARIDEHDFRTRVVDDRQRSVIGEPARASPLVIGTGIPQQVRWTNRYRIGPLRGVRADRPAIGSPSPIGYDSPAIGIKKDRPALPRLQVGELTAPIRVPEPDAIVRRGCEYLTVGTKVSSSNAAADPPLGEVAGHAGMECQALGGRGHIPDADDSRALVKASRRSSGAKPEKPFFGATTRDSPEVASQSRVVSS